MSPTRTRATRGYANDWHQPDRRPATARNQASTRRARSEPLECQRHVQSSTRLALEAMTEEGLGAFEAIRDRPIGEVEPARGLAAVLAGSKNTWSVSISSCPSVRRQGGDPAHGRR